MHVIDDRAEIFALIEHQIGVGEEDDLLITSTAYWLLMDVQCQFTEAGSYKLPSNTAKLFMQLACASNSVMPETMGVTWANPVVTAFYLTWLAYIVDTGTEKVTLRDFLPDMLRIAGWLDALLITTIDDGVFLVSTPGFEAEQNFGVRVKLE